MLLPGIFVLAALAVLIGLGTWQLERRVWKQNLITTLEQRLAAAPAPLPPRVQWRDLDRADYEFRRVLFRAVFPSDQEARVYTSGSGLRDDIKAPGYFAFAPGRLADGRVVVVDRGYVVNPSPDASLRPIGVSGGAVEVIGVMRWPEPPGWFVTAYDTRQNLWFGRDHLAMAARYGWGEVAPFYIDQEAPVLAGGVPRPAPLKINLRNDHLQYAITWYGVAVMLAVVFVFWFRSRRREVSSSAKRSA